MKLYLACIVCDEELDETEEPTFAVDPTDGIRYQCHQRCVSEDQSQKVVE